MDPNFLQAVLGQPTPPQDPASQAIAARPGLFQRITNENPPFTSQPSPGNPAIPVPLTSTSGPDFANADARALSQAGSEYDKGNYLAAIGNAARGVVAYPVAAAVDAGAALGNGLKEVGRTAFQPLPAAPSSKGSPVGNAASEFLRGLSGAAPISDAYAAQPIQKGSKQSPTFAPGGQFTPPPTNGDALTAAASAITGAPALSQAPAPVIDKDTLQAQHPAAHDHVSSNGGFGITPEFLSKLPKQQAEAIRGAGGITMGHLMQLLQANAPQNSAAEIAKSNYTKHGEALGQLKLDYPGLSIDDKGAVTLPGDLLAKGRDAAEEAKKEQLRRAVQHQALYHYYGLHANSWAPNQLNAIGQQY